MKKNDDYNNDSDTDEGFVPSKIIINQKQAFLPKQQIQHEEKQEALEFCPRYITPGIMKKEPSQCYRRFSKFDLVQNPSLPIDDSLNENVQDISPSSTQPFRHFQETPTQQKAQKKLQTPYEKFISSGEFTLIYSRPNDLELGRENQNFAKNVVNLNCLQNKEEINFKSVKPFQVTNQSKVFVHQKPSPNQSLNEKVLDFDSRFECGNLLCAFKSKEESFNYYLLIQNDTNSNGYNQWFYFSIKNVQAGAKYKFNILNFRKRYSFFKEGNCPVVFSLLDSEKQGLSGYSKRGSNVNYKKSPIINFEGSKQKFFQLSFELQFNNQDDIYYISMGLPYSYSKLIHSLKQCENKAHKNGIFWKTENIGFSVANNKVPYLTITKEHSQPKYQQSEQYIDQDQSSKKNKIPKSLSNKKKKVIFIMARQHPGETWASYLMDQILYQLSNPSQEETYSLLENYTIKCVPMVNVDGVISGNFRCDLVGMDLNRNWRSPSKLLHPQIHEIKSEIAKLATEGYKIECCLDLHGHSKQYNVFCYSCKTDEYECRILPYMFSELNNEFHFPFCTFGISKYKKSTARAVLFDIVKHPNVLTIESSFYGSKIQGKLQDFQPGSFLRMSRAILKATKSYLIRDDFYKACKQIVQMKISQFLKLGSKIQDGNNFSGSDSEPSGDQITIEEKLNTIIPKILQTGCLQLQKSQKKTKKKKRRQKKNPFQTLTEKQFFKIKKASVSQNESRMINLISQKEPKQEIKTQNQIKRHSFYKKNQNGTIRVSSLKKSAQKVVYETIAEPASSRKPYLRNLLNKQDNKLLFLSKDKNQMVPLKLKNQSFQIFKDAYNATQKNIRSQKNSLQDSRNQRRNKIKIGVSRQRHEKDEQFPLLCVFSESKKKNHAQKLVEKRQKDKEKSNDMKIPEKVKTIIQTRTEAIKQLREKNKNSMELVSKIWRQNFARYGMAYSTFKISK